MRGGNVRRILGAGVAVALLSSCYRTTEVGEVKNPKVVIDRDGAASAMLGGKVFWAFGDTIAPGGIVRNSGAYADKADPTKVTDTLYSNAPRQLVPFTAEEEAANRAATDGSQWVIWPTSIIPTSSDRALIFSSKFLATPQGWVNGTLVISEIKAGSTQSTRLAEPLSSPTPNYATGIYAQGGYVYLHDCGGVNLPPETTRTANGLLGAGDLGALNITPGKCRVARVPIDKATDALSYRYWSGAAWLPTAATAIGVVPGSNSGLSVAWNPKLGKYVALSTPGFSKDIQMSTAPKPEGPWTKPTVVYTAETTIYATRIHPHLSATDMSTMAITYYRSDQVATTDKAAKKGAVVLADFTIN